MTVQYLALLACVPAVLALVWQLRNLNTYYDNHSFLIQFMLQDMKRLEDKTTNLLDNIDRIDTTINTDIAPRLNALGKQLDAITHHLQPQLDDCRHEYRYLSHEHHITRFQCDWCQQIIDIDPSEQLERLRNNP